MGGGGGAIGYILGFSFQFFSVLDLGLARIQVEVRFRGNRERSDRGLAHCDLMEGWCDTDTWIHTHDITAASRQLLRQTSKANSSAMKQSSRAPLRRNRRRRSACSAQVHAALQLRSHVITFHDDEM